MTDLPYKMSRHSKARRLKRLERIKRAQAPPYHISWCCPDCYAILGSAEISQSEALRNLRKHQETAHSKQPIQVQSAVAVPARSEMTGVERKEDQITPLVITGPPGVPVERFPFKLLPPGSWDLKYVINYYHQQAHHFPAEFRDRKIDEIRLKMIYKWLRPIKVYVGEKHWRGYIAFEFSGTDRVLLECPFKGNAIYVFWGAWKSMVAHTKQYVWTHFPKNHRRIFHAGDWLKWTARALRPNDLHPTFP